MPHFEVAAIRRILSGDCGPQEIERLAEHLVACGGCRALAEIVAEEVRAKRPGSRQEGTLQFVFDLLDRDSRWAKEYLAAVAERAAQRRNPNRRAQRDRVRMLEQCHTDAFFNLLLGELREESAWEEAEFLASLALLAIERRVQRQQIAEAVGHDLQAKVWAAVANARRRAAEWPRAHKALTDAEKHWKEGTQEDPRLEAEILSITASTLADEGHVSQALAALEKCRAIYDALSEWALLARTLVKQANILAGAEPAKALVALDHALPLIPAEDARLTLFAEMLRVECLIEVRKPREAMRVFRRSSDLLAANPEIRIKTRGKFTGARLLDALGSQSQADQLFTEVVESDIDHELYRDAFLDLLYLYERHMKAGNLEKAARICRKALTNGSLVAITHDQMRDVWAQLLEATQQQALGPEVLRDLRQYLSVHWKHPASTPPVVAFH